MRFKYQIMKNKLISGLKLSFFYFNNRKVFFFEKIKLSIFLERKGIKFNPKRIHIKPNRFLLLADIGRFRMAAKFEEERRKAIAKFSNASLTIKAIKIVEPWPNG